MYLLKFMLIKALFTTPQVWFQNARAKEKKSRNNRFTEESVSQSENEFTSNPTVADECKICNVVYNDQNPMQEHVFSAQHINRIRSILENGEHTGSEHNLITTNDEATNDDDNDMNDDKRGGDQLQQLKNFKTKSPIAIDPASDKLGFYNQFLLQNNMLGQSNNTESSDNTNTADNGVAPESFLNILRMQQMQQQQQQTQNNQPGQSTVEENNGLENNLLLQINTDKASNPATTNNNEILQQLYNYSQMSGKLIK